MPLSRSLLSRRFSISFRESQGGKTPPEADSHQPPPPTTTKMMLPPPPLNGAAGSSWSAMLPELLGEIIRRVEDSEDQWPHRRDVVSCACVSKKWREIAQEIVRSPLNSGKITFPSCLKLPGPREFSNQCLIKRNKKTSTFYLYLALTPSFTDKGKFLLAARRFRTGAYTEYIISLDADFSQGSNAYVGKLRSDFLGTNFTIYDRQPPHNGAKPSNGKASRRFASKQISPQVSAGNFEVGHVSYKFNLLKSRGPRRMISTLRCPSSSSPPPTLSTDQNSCDVVTKMVKKPKKDGSGLTILKNKAPRWHEHLQCWCLNFHGRVTLASVNNFQLAGSVDQSQQGGIGDEEDDTLWMYQTCKSEENRKNCCCINQ